MNRRLISFISAFFTVLILIAQPVIAKDIAVIAREDFPTETLSAYDVKQIYMGIKLFIGNTKLNPVDQSRRNSIKNLFLEKVMELNPVDYENYWLVRTFGGVIPPSEKNSSSEVISSVLRNKNAIGYVWRDEAKTEGVKILLVIPDN